MHQFISKNESGRDFAVGDIHGHYDLLSGQLRYVGFDKTKDRLFSVSDLIDRGAESEKCLKFLQEPWFHMVRGNHEEMLINASTGNGESYNWWSSYGRWANRMDPESVRAWAVRLQALPVLMTLEMDGYSVGICHAEPDGLDWVK